MKRKLCWLIVLTFSWPCCLIAADPGWMFSPPEIEGSERFERQIKRALHLIKRGSPQSYQMVCRHVAVIKQSDRSGMWVTKKRPTFDIADRTSFHSVTWCAGSIAHDAYHAVLYQDHLITQTGSVPHDVYAGKDAELKCIAIQIKVLESIHAPKSEIAHCKSQDGTHFDLDGDGQLTWQDYLLRDW